MRPFLLLLALAGTALCEDVVRQASQARLWLRVGEGGAPLPDVQVSAGSASPLSSGKETPPKDQATDVSFPIHWWSWSNITISFTPSQDESVEIILNGPWTGGKDGKPLRQEILWDSIQATGATIENPGFETQTDGTPTGWKSSYGPYLKSGEWPLDTIEPMEGKNVAATWHNRPLSQIIQVKAGQLVTLQFQAKSATPPGFVAPKRLPANTAAHKAAARLKRGMNLGNCWEAPPPYTWGIRFTADDIDRIAAEGFDHIRVPVAWQHYLKPGDSGQVIDPALLADLEPVLRRALEKKLHILLDWHHFDDLTTDPVANRARFVQGWKTITTHFKSWPEALYFELLNEPRDALTTEVANDLYAETLAEIRRICPDRAILVSPGSYGDIKELDRLKLPDQDDHLIVTLHCYDPFYFTHQKAGWVQLGGLRGLRYPGPPASPLEVPASMQDNEAVKNFIHDYNTLPADRNPSSAISIRKLLDAARAWSEYFGRPVHLGEFGSHDAGDLESRLRYTRDVRTMAEARGIPWTLWEWKASFGYWDSNNNKALLREALTGN